MLVNEREHIRELGYRRILEARQIFLKKKTVRNFVPPKINFQASDHIEIINWNSCVVYPSPMLRDLSEDILNHSSILTLRPSEKYISFSVTPRLWRGRIFGSNWRDVHSVLYNDSSFIWYEDKSRQESKGGVVLKDAPELIAFGTFTSQVPDRPDLPDHYEPKELLAFGVRGTKTVYWFLCPNEEEVT
ncbi:hypothetical protein AVEN_79148-1 [Araneus ventricosus]|uniref:Uncharacterized protein n=1 Tax=Araneus ventricosus TaxID=182803 RepID=A0A4Y2LN12_ARAVE|nr:hypothetical protein AVEN_79148-1 [Araneus ventricosus]